MTRDGQLALTTPAHIRLARVDELPGLRDLERSAGEPFRAIGMPEIADDEPLSLPELAHYQRAGRAWVVTLPSGTVGLSVAAGSPLGYLLAEPVDGYLHIAQVSVHPAAAGRGLGRRLIEHLAEVAGSTGVVGLSLTTYVDVPWNGPYYRRLGFVELPERELGPGLRAIRELERKAGLDRWPRAAMVRPLPPDRRIRPAAD